MPLSASFTNAFQINVLDMLANNGIYTPPVNGLELALFTQDPGESGSLTDEITGNGYERQSFFFNAPQSNAGGTQASFITNSADIVFTASGGTFQDAAGQTGVGFMGVMHRKSWSRTYDYNVPFSNRIEIPSSYYPVAATLTVTTVEQDSSTGYMKLNLTTGSYTSGTYTTTDALGACNYCVRIKSGALAGTVHEIKDDSTDTLVLYAGAGAAEEDWNGHDIEIVRKLTISEVFGTPSGSMASGVVGADQFWIYHNELSGTYTQSAYIYADTAAGHWSDANSNTNIASGSGGCDDLVLNPLELVATNDDPGSKDDGIYMYPANSRTANFTLTSQYSTTDVMVARARFESGGSAVTHTVTSGSTLTIAAGDLNLTLS